MDVKNNQHVEKTNIVVYKTKNYELFKPIRSNRVINESHVQKLVSSMRHKGFLVQPVNVNKGFKMIDGQHRIEAARRTHEPVYFIVNPNYGKEEMIELNLSQQNWGKNDYLNYYAENGFKAYETLQHFMEKYDEFNLSSCIKLLQNNNAKRSRFHRFGRRSYQATQVFEEGTWKPGDVELAHKWANNIRKLKHFYDGYTRGYFVSVMISLFKNSQFNFDRFLSKLELQPTALRDCANRDQYLDLIERIYNYKAQDKVNLRYTT